MGKLVEFYRFQATYVNMAQLKVSGDQVEKYAASHGRQETPARKSKT